MKDWIKDTIREANFGYLIFFSQKRLQTIPFPFEYRQGRLVSYFSVLLADLLVDLQRSPSILLFIQMNEVKVKITVDIDILEDSLQDVSQITSSVVHDYFLEDIDPLKNLDYFNKQVEIILTPKKIIALSEEEELTYEMEIL